MSNDYFKHIAGRYDGDDKRISNVENIAQTIIKNLKLAPQMELMDFGSGTGLLLERIAPMVQKITAIDVSKSMTDQLESKCDQIDCEIDIRQIDLVSTDITDKFDGIISSMTFHHIKDIATLLTKFHGLLKPGGFIAIADLDQEAGTFHTEDTGVHHLGFDRTQIADLADQAGFKNVKVVDASVIQKNEKSYPVFLLSATK